MSKIKKLEIAENQFLKVRKILSDNNEYSALSKAYKKPWRWYREHTTLEAIEILRTEVN